MRIAPLVAPAMLLLLGACQRAEANHGEALAKPGVELTLDVPQGEVAQVVTVVTRDIAQFGEIPWHTHSGVEIAYVESGNVELAMAGRETLQLGPGGHFMVPRGVVHSGRNTGNQPVRLVLTYVVDKGAPLRLPAEAPKP